MAQSRLKAVYLLLDGLVALAHLTAVQTNRFQSAMRRRGGTALHPGRETPLWNELMTQAGRQLRRRGDQAKLARFLGVPRQRVHEFLRRRDRLPDAERTLRLLVWLVARQSGRDPG